MRLLVLNIARIDNGVKAARPQAPFPDIVFPLDPRGDAGQRHLEVPSSPLGQEADMPVVRYGFPRVGLNRRGEFASKPFLLRSSRPTLRKVEVLRALRADTPTRVLNGMAAGALTLKAAS